MLKRVRRLFQIERNYSLELSKHCDVLFENNKKQPSLRFRVSFGLELLVFFIFSVYSLFL